MRTPTTSKIGVKYIVLRLLYSRDEIDQDRTGVRVEDEPGWLEEANTYATVIIMTLIVLSVLGVLLESVQGIRSRFGTELFAFEVFAVMVFTVEYLGRLWTCTLTRFFSSGSWRRLRWSRSPMAVIDLLAILPFYLPFLGVDARFLRVLRLMRVVRLAKLDRYFHSINLIGKVWKERRYEIVMSTVVMFFILLIASALMYHAERAIQPDNFGSIPESMWWAIATLTTVGYGDVTPISGLGRAMAGVVALIGIALVALPAGILSSGFVDELERQRQEKAKEEAEQEGNAPGFSCPHCGKPIHVTVDD